MDTLQTFIGSLNALVWGPPMLVLILGVGLFLQIGLRGMPVLRIGTGFRLLWQGRAPSSGATGELPPFQALMTALSATVGTGNIAGVATAVFLGGPGALFWMWCTALVGMATKYAEAVLAVRFREQDEAGQYVGGPMYYIRNGLGARWAWLGGAFAVFGTVAGFGIGNTVQSNSVADVLEAAFGVPPLGSGLALMVLAGAVLLGGIRRIGRVAGALVPAMALGYVLAALLVLALRAPEVPHALGLVFRHAFTPTAAEGGFAGAAVWAAMRFGVARGIFSNEAGLGSAAIAHAAARTHDPVGQGMVAMLGTFIDTIVICTLTGLVILTSGLWTTGTSGAELTSDAFAAALPGVGGKLVAVALAVFAFTTILGWSYYGERCAEYLLGVRVIVPFRVCWTVAILAGTLVELDLVWRVADTLNALMALPNLVALLLLGPVVFRLTREALGGGSGRPR